MTMPKEIFWMIVTAAGFLLSAEHHLSQSLGADMFEALAIPVDTVTGNGGRFHYLQLTGLILMIAGLIGMNRAYRAKGKQAGLWLVVSLFAAHAVYPFITEKIMISVHFFAEDQRSVAYSPEQSSCKLDWQNIDGELKGDCQFVIYNYGQAKKAEINPLLHELELHPEGMDVEPVQLNFTGLLPHKKNIVQLSFSGKASFAEPVSSWGGEFSPVPAELKVVSGDGFFTAELGENKDP